MLRKYFNFKVIFLIAFLFLPTFTILFPRVNLLSSFPVRQILKNVLPTCPQCHHLSRLLLLPIGPNSECINSAISLQQVNKSSYLAYKCSSKNIPISGTSKSLEYIRVVAGEIVEPQWEFECGYFNDCAVSSAWFDDEGKIVAGLTTQPRNFIIDDPAVGINGCVSQISGYNKVDRELVFDNGQYLWKTVYKNMRIENDWGDCILNGVSYFNDVTNKSYVVMKHVPKVSDCKSLDRYSTCRDALSYITNSPEYCVFFGKDYYGNDNSWKDDECIMKHNARQMKK